jgi:AcrR family transcriptional regulator
VNTDATPAAADAHQGRRAAISREDLITAALRLIGPHRSVSTLSLREVARAADIAPNSFYRHFRDIDALAVALIELAGRSLREIIRNARIRAGEGGSTVQSSVRVFLEQIRADGKLLHVLLREGTAGSDAFKAAVDRELNHFEEELYADLVRYDTGSNRPLYQPRVVARAVTRLVFALGATAMDRPAAADGELAEQMTAMVRMILLGARSMGERARKPAG